MQTTVLVSIQTDRYLASAGSLPFTRYGPKVNKDNSTKTFSNQAKCEKLVFFKLTGGEEVLKFDAHIYSFENCWFLFSRVLPALWHVLVGNQRMLRESPFVQVRKTESSLWMNPPSEGYRQCIDEDSSIESEEPKAVCGWVTISSITDSCLPATFGLVSN
jgi:hypothetical protein